MFYKFIITFAIIFVFVMELLAAEYPPDEPPSPTTFTFSKKIISQDTEQPMSGVLGKVSLKYNQKIVYRDGSSSGSWQRSKSKESNVNNDGYLTVQIQLASWEGPYYQDGREYWYKNYSTSWTVPELYFCETPVWINEEVYSSRPTSSWNDNSIDFTEIGINNYLSASYKAELLPHYYEWESNELFLDVPSIDLLANGKIQLLYSFTGTITIEEIEVYFEGELNAATFISTTVRSDGATLVGISLANLDFGTAIQFSLIEVPGLSAEVKLELEDVLKDILTDNADLIFAVVTPIIGVGTDAMYVEVRLSNAEPNPIEFHGGTSNDYLKVYLQSRWVLGY